MDDHSDGLITEIEDTLSKTEGWIHSVLDHLGWSEEHVMQNEEKVACPVDPHHFVPTCTLDKHLQYCPLLKDGYTKDDLVEERNKSHKFYYEKSDKVVCIDIDDDTACRILSRLPFPGPTSAVLPVPGRHLPATTERAIVDLSPQERLRLYEFCLQTAQTINKAVAIPAEDLQLLEMKDNDASRPKTKFERMAEERDMKRRRQSYRKKNVHSGRKSYNEVIKEVIEQQTGLLTDVWQEQDRETDRIAAKNRRHKFDKEADVSDDSRDDKRNHGDRGVTDKHRYKRSRSRSSDSDESRRRRHKHKHKKHKNKHKERGKDKEKEKERDQERDKDLDKDKDRPQDKSRDKDRPQDKEIDEDKLKDGDKDTDDVKEQKTDQNEDKNKNTDQIEDNNEDKNEDQDTNKNRD